MIAGKSILRSSSATTRKSSSKPNTFTNQPSSRARPSPRRNSARLGANLKRPEIEPRPAHADAVQSVQFRLADAVVDDGDAAIVPPRRTFKNIVHQPVIGA